MKKYYLLFVLLLLLGCDEELPNQLTTVEGYVKD